MFEDYIFTKSRRTILSLESSPTKKRWTRIFTFLTLFLLSIGMQAQTTLIGTSIGGTSVADGTFSTGATFAANGWTVANEGTSSIKWQVGTAVNSGSITGNSAYVSIDGGVTNSQAGLQQARTIYFYKDVAIPAGETNIALTFDSKSAANSWNVYIAPTSLGVVGSDLQTNSSFSPYSLAGATTVVTGTTTVTSSSNIGFLPAATAGTTVRLIFMWTNNTGGTNPPVAIDNIKLVSRAGGAYFQSIASGNYTDPATWDLGYVPSFSDDVQISENHTVNINAKGLGVHDLYIVGTNAFLNFDVNSDAFSISNDLAIDGTGARFNSFQGTGSIRQIYVGHDISVSGGGRLDCSFGYLNLNGSTVQSISVDNTGFFGGTAVGTTSSANTANVIAFLNISNTSTATPNINWDINGVKIKSGLTLKNARVDLGNNKITIGNYGAITSASSLVFSLDSGFIGGTIGKWYATGANPSTGIAPGTEYNNTGQAFPAINAAGENRWAFVLSPAGGTTQGEIAVQYVDGMGTTPINVTDGAYTITDQYNGAWSISSTDYANPNATFSVGLYGSGAYFAKDGNSRVMKMASVVGTHVNGTTTPFAARQGLTLADITTGSFFLGVNATTAQAASNKTSVASGNWGDAATWLPVGVPTCSDVVTIASGHTVTVGSVGSAAGVTIKAGGTLVNAVGGDLTVGCTNNNAIFTNFGSNIVSGGKLTINGSASHRVGSTFAQSAGDIIVDSNDKGNAATSVGQGGSSFLIATSNVTLIGGKITIVDPLINNTAATTANTITNFTMNTVVNFERNTLGTVETAAGSNVIVMAGGGANSFYVGQVISGPGIPAGTTITNVFVPATGFNQPFTLTVSNATTAVIPVATPLTFSAMSVGGNGLNFSKTDPNWQLAEQSVGMLVSGPGIPAGTYITSTTSSSVDPAYTVLLSNPVGAALGTSPITAAQTITFAGISPNSTFVILTDVNPLIMAGQVIGGAGIAPGATVVSINTVGTQSKLTMSLPATASVAAPVALSFLDGNLSSYAFAYNAPTNCVAGLGHTLQIGDGTSTDKGAITTNGFLCDFIQGGGSFSMGNLTIDAPEGQDRFFNTNGIVVVQGDFTITEGSVFKKSKNTGGISFGGNVTNDGTLYAVKNTQVSFSNPTAADASTSLPQKVSGGGNFYNDIAESTATAAFTTLVVNNTSAAGLTIAVPDFRVSNNITMTNGIIHTTNDTPLYQGTADLASFGTSISGNFSDTCYIDGPFEKTIMANTTSSQTYVYPVGKTTYQPVFMGATGGAIFRAEAFDTNSGTASASVANLSAKRWAVSRKDTNGLLTDFKVTLGDAGIASNNIIVQAATDQGEYTNTFGDTAIFTAGTPNTLATATITPGAQFTGNFAYATLPNCTTVNPGKTLINTTVTKEITIARTPTGTGNTSIVMGSPVVKLFEANINIAPGMIASNATYFPAGTTVVSIDNATLTLTLSQPALASTPSSPTAYIVFSEVSTPTSLCGAQQVTLSLENVVAGNGVTYQWEGSMDNVTYSPINGATTATYTASAATPWYRCAVTCTYGPSTAYSTPVEVSFTNNITEAEPVTTCAPGAVTLTATASAGTINWYADETTATPLASGPTYEPTISEDTTFYVATEVVTGPYTTGPKFSKTGSGTSPMTGLVFNALSNLTLNSVNVYPVQTALGLNLPMTIGLYDKNGNLVAGTSKVVFTPNETTVVGTAQTVNLNYFIPAGTGYKLLITDGITSTNKLGTLYVAPAYPLGASASSVVLTAGSTSFNGLSTDTYYNFFEWDVTDICSSPRVAVAATITPTALPTASAQTFCKGATVADLEATGTDLKWYIVPGSLPLASDIPLVTGSFYVSQTLNGCESALLEVAVTVNTTALPTASAQTFCKGATVADLVATGTDLKWYIVPGSVALAPTVPLVTGSFYVSQTLNGCESELLEVAVTVNTTALPTASAQTFCKAATVADLEATGTDIKWYIVPGSLPLASDIPLVTGSFYVSQTLNGCESELLEVAVTVNTTALPTASAQTFCKGATVADLVATGTDIKWYIVPGSLPLASDIPLVTGSFYVSQTLNGCESELLEVAVTVNTTALPTASAQTFCKGATVADLVATGTDIKWYIVPGSLPLASDIPLVTGSFYVSQTLNGCESELLEVAVTVNTTAMPTSEGQNFCKSSNPTVADLVATGTDLKWYIVPGSLPLASNIPLVSGSYYVTQTLNGCESELFEIAVVVSTVNAPTGETTQTFTEGQTIADIVVSATGTVVWYASASDAASGINPLLGQTALVNNTTYYATQTEGTCTSTTSLAVTVTVALGVNDFDSNSFRSYPNPVHNVLNISYSKEISAVKIFNVLGQEVMNSNVHAVNAEINVSNLSNGTYFVKVTSENATKTFKIVKK